MLTTVDALKTLYTALGGNAEEVVNVVTIPDMISEIATQVETNRESEETTEP